MRVSLKPGAKLHRPNRFRDPGLVWAFAFPIITAAFNELEYDCVVTEVVGGAHGNDSLHYHGLAVDLRTNHMKPDHRIEVAMNLTSALGPDFDVVLEEDHLHVELDPK